VTRADLPQPSTDAGRAGLAALLADPGRALVGLDFDGTLAPVVPDPDAARGHPDVPGVLARLAAAGVRVAVVTGRPAATAVEYAGIADVPGLVVLGHYGLERWEAGTLTAPEDLSAVAQARRRLPDVLAAAGAPDGTYVEDKGAAVAGHPRRTADPPAASALRRGPLTALAGEVGLVVEPGRFVLELRPAGGDKGDALRTLVGERTPSVVVFVGDDLGDLAAFDAVDRLRAAGTPGLLVCSGSTEVPALADRADVIVDGPDGVVALLRALADALKISRPVNSGPSALPTPGHDRKDPRP
jgi:trehalose 6-phosphate phosphatase